MNFYELFEDTLDNLKDKQVIEKKAIAALNVSWMKYILKTCRKGDVKYTYNFQIMSHMRRESRVFKRYAIALNKMRASVIREASFSHHKSKFITYSKEHRRVE